MVARKTILSVDYSAHLQHLELANTAINGLLRCQAACSHIDESEQVAAAARLAVTRLDDLVVCLRNQLSKEVIDGDADEEWDDDDDDDDDEWDDDDDDDDEWEGFVELAIFGSGVSILGEPKKGQIFEVDRESRRALVHITQQAQNPFSARTFEWKHFFQIVFDSDYSLPSVLSSSPNDYKKAFSSWEQCYNETSSGDVFRVVGWGHPCRIDSVDHHIRCVRATWVGVDTDAIESKGGVFHWSELVPANKQGAPSEGSASAQTESTD